MLTNGHQYFTANKTAAKREGVHALVEANQKTGKGVFVRARNKEFFGLTSCYDTWSCFERRHGDNEKLVPGKWDNTIHTREEALV